ncbi:hypothetical protein DP939_08125 [Spongiactinospora rosea]|uniref:DUF998 domain-containing protein n=1 Tax=Spongiactinospora rosea TaxID=2248750 RepID=A0A366M4A4_9ACTN|nr:DUF6518 family protein [Spongiactinospora rosea]RBQ21011.1 hypothetical protein DP939_08125 [Spongiactinospora rosea]
MTNSQESGRTGSLQSVWILVGAVALGAAFGAATSIVNGIAISLHDLESRDYSMSGWSGPEIVSLMIDSGWAWAGAAVAAGWLLTRRSGLGRTAELWHAAIAGALALVTATAAYDLADAVRSGDFHRWYEFGGAYWFVLAVLLGPPLGVAGAYIKRPGVAGLLARLVVPVGAAVQMAVLPPGRNDVVRGIGQAVVWTLAALTIGFIVVRFGLAERRRRALTEGFR